MKEGSDFSPRQQESAEAITDPERAIKEYILEKFDGDAPDVLFSLGAGIKEDKNADKRVYPEGGIVDRFEEGEIEKDPRGYRTTAFSDLSEHGFVLGSRTRVIATAEIAKVFPEMPVVATSRYFPEEPKMAHVIGMELEERGVNAERIQYEENSMNTITQITELIKMSAEKGWKRVAVLTNDYHFPRMNEMLNQLEKLVEDPAFQDDPELKDALEEFKTEGGDIGFVLAEDVMTKQSKRFADYLDKVRATEEFQRTLEAEAKGVRDLKSGAYKITLKTKSKE